MLLADWGHEVEDAASGPKAVERLEAGPFDTIFTDVRMPRMNGVELLRLIRERWPRTFVVMVTGYATVETAVESMKLGAFDYLRKPFRSEQVERIVDLIEEERAYVGAGEVAEDPFRLASQWARGRKHEVLLIGAVPPRSIAGVTAVELPSRDSPKGLQAEVIEFLDAHGSPAVILVGVERFLAQRSTEEGVSVLADLIGRAQARGPVAVGFDPGRVSKAPVEALRAAVAATRVHDTLGALANPLRRLILRRLDQGSTSFTGVMRAAGLDDSPKLSFHLRTLQDGGLIAHAGDEYHLTPEGEESVRVLKEVDRIGASTGARSFLFTTEKQAGSPSPRP